RADARAAAAGGDRARHVDRRAAVGVLVIGAAAGGARASSEVAVVSHALDRDVDRGGSVEGVLALRVDRRHRAEACECVAEDGRHGYREQPKERERKDEARASLVVAAASSPRRENQAGHVSRLVALRSNAKPLGWAMCHVTLRTAEQSAFGTHVGSAVVAVSTGATTTWPVTLVPWQRTRTSWRV